MAELDNTFDIPVVIKITNKSLTSGTEEITSPKPYKILSDKAGLAYSSYTYFPKYDFTVFEKGRRPSSLDWSMFASLYVFSCNVLPQSIKVELSLAKFLRISEENFKRFMKKIPQELFRKSGHIDSRGGDISLDAENLIKKYLGEDQSAFENNPFLKFYSEVDFA